MPTTDHKLSTTDRRLIEDAADALSVAFRWRDSPQGFDYWVTIYNTLTDMAKGKA